MTLNISLSLTDTGVDNGVRTVLDERLADALKSANFRKSLAIQRQNAKLKFERDSILTRNGGVFFANRDLINFTKLLVDMESESIVVIDNNGLPILIDNPSDFLTDLLDRYAFATQTYLAEHIRLTKARSSAATIGE